MRLQNFIGGSYLSASPDWSVDRTFNLYPEINEVRPGKDREAAMLIGTPGLLSLATLGSGPVRCAHTASNGRLFIVSGPTLYEIDQFWTATSRGTLSTSGGLVSMDDNGVHVMIVDGPNGYTFTFTTNTFAAITDADFPGAVTTRFVDGYFVFNEPGTGRAWSTASYNGASVDGLDFATAEARPDDLVAVEADHRTLYLLGVDTIERYYNAGLSAFPFSAYQTGGLIEVGCVSPGSVQKLNAGLYWLGRDKNGSSGVYRINQNGISERVSTHAIDLMIRAAGDLSAARSWVYQEGGHHFYRLNLPDSTPTFDTATGLWHECTYFDTGLHTRHRAECHAFAFDAHVVGDYENGNIYALDPDTYTDNGDEIARERTTPHVSQDGARIFIPRIELSIEAGVGLDGGVTPGADPQLMLQISRDGGHSYGTERWVSAGKLGEYTRRAIWNRNGQGRNIVIRVRMTDPVKAVWLGMNLAGISASAA